MFSKATLIGVVGVEPKYKAAIDGKDSLIAFRLGCEVFTNSKKITEWYTIKAFGRVADYLHQTIKKDSSVFLEASIRNKRWTVNG
ncbi:single-stranded DNA-binding protein, partial [Klebsiella pneumoniae]